MERLFFTINELTARAAKEANSMSGYVAGSATSEYQNMVNRVYDTVEKIKEKKPNLAEKAQHMAQRYSRKLAEYFNAHYRNEASCPSILISGAGNFPVRKKEKQKKRKLNLQPFRFQACCHAWYISLRKMEMKRPSFYWSRSLSGILINCF